MRHKNGFWTFCFSFIPGAGQMYQGYMKRGLSHITLFCLFLGLAIITGGLLSVVLPIIWMYSFFDSFNLRSQLMEGTAPPDDYPDYLKNRDSLTKLVAVKPKLLGWGLILMGAYSLYQMIILPFAWDLYDRYDLYWLARLLDRLPSLALAVALILVGLWLVRGKKQPEQEEFPYYEHQEDGHGTDQ